MSHIINSGSTIFRSGSKGDGPLWGRPPLGTAPSGDGPLWGVFTCFRSEEFLNVNISRTEVQLPSVQALQTSMDDLWLLLLSMVLK